MLNSRFATGSGFALHHTMHWQLPYYAGGGRIRVTGATYAPLLYVYTYSLQWRC